MDSGQLDGGVQGFELRARARAWRSVPGASGVIVTGQIVAALAINQIVHAHSPLTSSAGAAQPRGPVVAPSKRGRRWHCTAAEPGVRWPLRPNFRGTNYLGFSALEGPGRVE